MRTGKAGEDRRSGKAEVRKRRSRDAKERRQGSGGRADGKKYEVSEERAENLGRRESEETGWTQAKAGVKRRRAKARKVRD